MSTTNAAGSRRPVSPAGPPDLGLDLEPAREAPGTTGDVPDGSIATGDPPESSDLRVGDAERAAAEQALQAHLQAGRITVDEYVDRSGAAVSATSGSALAALFTDLPAPHPSLPQPARAGTASLPGPRTPPPAVISPAGVAGLSAPLLVSVLLLVAAVPTVTASPAAVWLLLPLLVLMLGGSTTTTADRQPR